MMVLHIGMPKTGTSSLQEALYKATKLSNADFLYPNTGRKNGNAIAHHELALSLRTASPSSAIIAQLLTELTQTKTEKMIISSEFFSNLLQPRSLQKFLPILRRFNKVRPLCIFISIRELSSFLESMYLQSARAKYSIPDIPNYIRKRHNWTVNFFAGLSILSSDDAFGLRAVYVDPKYDSLKSKEYIANPPTDALHIHRSNIRHTKRLTLKKQVVLNHFQNITAKEYILLTPKAFFASCDVEMTFPNDIFHYAVSDTDHVLKIQSIVNAASATHFKNYNKTIHIEPLYARLPKATLSPGIIVHQRIEILTPYLVTAISSGPRQ